MPKRTRSKSNASGRGKKRKVSTAQKVRKAKASTSRDVLTDQFDKRVDYVYVAKKSKNLKKDIAFKKKVAKAIRAEEPPMTKLITTAVATTAGTTSTEQVWQVFHLKAFRGQAAAPGAGSLYDEKAQEDIHVISGNLTTGGLSANFHIKSCYMDVFVENTGANDAIVEIYELEYLKREGNPMNVAGTFQSLLASGLTATGTSYSLNYRGTTIFDLPNLIRNYGVRVVKKVTSVLNANDKTMYTLKDYRKQYVNLNTIAQDLASKFCIQGMTKSVVVIAKPFTSDGAVTIKCSADKHYKVQPITEAFQDDNFGGRD